jgi:hypothetical protein
LETGGPVYAVIVAMHFLFSTLPLILLGLDPQRRLLAKFTCTLCVLNFLCLLNSFPWLGYGNGGGLWDFSTAAGGGGPFVACQK